MKSLFAHVLAQSLSGAVLEILSATGDVLATFTLPALTAEDDVLSAEVPETTTIATGHASTFRIRQGEAAIEGPVVKGKPANGMGLDSLDLTQGGKLSIERFRLKVRG